MGRTGDCRHFTGYQNGKCKVDVNYRTLVGGPDVGWAARLPCLPSSSLRKPPLAECTHFTPVTKDEERAQKKEAQERFAVISKAIQAIQKTGNASGIIVCPKCGENLHYSVAKSNGHVWGRCSTAGCLSWMM